MSGSGVLANNGKECVVRKKRPFWQLLNMVFENQLLFLEGITGTKPITHFYFRPGADLTLSIGDVGGVTDATSLLFMALPDDSDLNLDLTLAPSMVDD
ncbi:hypothetical protein CMV_027118 [Castanea mollissima]|uniref:Uncharacterized protein n=1 Tax=Castanea mollissima TaxID=60419 RepID=A0A8J4QIU6_9ROSI|nr:hypothetical protein CMV_027118 [Castanea mollissima]